MVAPSLEPTTELGRSRQLAHFLTWIFAERRVASSIVDQNSPRFGLRIAVRTGDGDDMIHRVTVDVYAHDTKGVISAQAFLGQAGVTKARARPMFSTCARLNNLFASLSNLVSDRYLIGR